MAVEQVKLCYTLPGAFAASSSSRSMHFGDVSETSLDHVTRNASALRIKRPKIQAILHRCHSRHGARGHKWPGSIVYTPFLSTCARIRRWCSKANTVIVGHRFFVC